MGVAALGERPRRSTSGVPGYTVAQVSRLLGCSESTARKRPRSSEIVDAAGVALWGADEVDAERAALLARLGAVEPVKEADASIADLRRERDDLRKRVANLEEKFRLVLAARAAAREAQRHRIAEEQALHDAALMDLEPLTK